MASTVPCTSSRLTIPTLPYPRSLTTARHTLSLTVMPLPMPGTMVFPAWLTLSRAALTLASAAPISSVIQEQTATAVRYSSPCRDRHILTALVQAMTPMVMSHASKTHTVLPRLARVIRSVLLAISASAPTAAVASVSVSLTLSVRTD